MKKLVLETSIEVYSDPKELSQVDQQLLAMAREALQDSYSPYSQFKVGAALLLDNGEMLPGSNQENASYSLCLCAERVALGSAASQYPKNAITAIAVTAHNHKVELNQPVSPCGACRQVIVETEHKHDHPIRIVLQGDTGDIYVLKSAKDLLPLSFDSSFLF